MPKWTIKVVNAEAKDFVQEVRTLLPSCAWRASHECVRHGCASHAVMHWLLSAAADSEGL